MKLTRLLFETFSIMLEREKDLICTDNKVDQWSMN